MSAVGVIGGTNADFELERPEESAVETPYGPAELVTGTVGDQRVVFVRRHGRGHARLSSQVNHRANVWALREAGCSAIVATTVCGVVDPAVPLAQPLVFDDLFFPDNRLPEGGPCTFFDKPGRPGRGHLIFGSPFSAQVREALVEAAGAAGIDVRRDGTYAYMLGPRFNSRTEIAWLRSVGAVALSQTAGPEAMLAAELEIPYALLGFGVDYANGVAETPTTLDELNANIAASKSVFSGIAGGAIARLGDAAFDTGFVYRFD